MMQVNLIFCLFVLDSEKNTNIRKNDLKKIKVLVDKNSDLPEISFHGGDMKAILRKNISSIIGTNLFHAEQVYTMSYKDYVDVIYFGATNIENIAHLKKSYKLIDFKVENNDTVILDNKLFKYKTVEIEANNNIEYIHEIETKDKVIKRNLMNLLISYKKIRSNIDNTDVLFKFMGNSFTLEEVRILYELIKDTKVDKSNFRKKIVKYCEKTDDKSYDKIGYRPSQRYRFKPLKGDVWL